MSKQENTKVLAIFQEYLPLDSLKELFVRLDEEVGEKTDDAPLKDWLKTMRHLVIPLPPPPWWLWGIFYCLVVIHFILVLGVGLSFILLPFLSPWYIALPVMTFIFFFSTTKVECQLTNAENLLRRRLGLKRIGGFVGFYMLRTLRRILGRKSRNP